ncbi:50S ribosomal protein L24 [Parenemella sanctibonifatiensis]|uniref:Large ribosomal subunit protein uL24 n=1 Tax=Parenemella sanctibonifatiensis TaxID=2016505 RepID=A0A255E7P4_9ACTN|nr:50S ribosomal protein L24 [Parenemella sanctibonifatiensis]OYN87569.1 50S ribosomal protein L24 [Parenemella sanctibonifatiensis]
MTLHVKKGDRVKVIAGKDKGSVGEIIAVDPHSERVTVEGVNIVKRHISQNQQQPNQQTGIVSREAPIHVSNVQLLVKDSDGNDVLTRVGYERREVQKRRADGTEYSAFRSVRIARKTGEEI